MRGRVALLASLVCASIAAQEPPVSEFKHQERKYRERNYQELKSEVPTLEHLKTLGDLRWRQRVLVINEPTSAESLYELLTANASALDERQLLWFTIVGQTLRSNYPGALDDGLRQSIQKQLGLKSGELILIGLDGGVKARDSQLDLTALYALIDAMPMRRAERRD